MFKHEEFPLEGILFRSLIHKNYHVKKKMVIICNFYLLCEKKCNLTLFSTKEIYIQNQKRIGLSEKIKYSIDVQL
jgi:hypothetical protein